MALTFTHVLKVVMIWRIFCIWFVAYSIGVILALERQGPFFIREPPHRVDFSNSTGSVVPCAAHGSPAPHVTWATRDGTLVNDVSGLRHIRPDGSLVFPPFRAEEFRQDVHSATYRCIAANSVGSIQSRDVHVRGVVQQHYVVEVYDEFVIEGNTAVFKCNIPGFIRDYVTVTSWIQDTTMVIHSSAHDGDRFSVFPSGVLHIRRVSKSDGQKTYRCETRHSLTGETLQSATFGTLFVTESVSNIPPRITDYKSTIVANQGETLELPCAAQGFPVPVYRWIKTEGGQSMPVRLGHRFMQLDGTLIIRQLLVQDGGRYRCIVNNTVGSEMRETELMVRAPLSVELHPRIQTVDVDRSTSFNCSVSGHPVSSVEWFHNRRPLVTSSRVRLVSLTLYISSVQREDKGMYQCVVFNDYDSAQGTAQLSLGDDAPTLMETFPEVRLDSGSSLSLKCIASGNPLPQVTWLLDEMPVPEDSRFRTGDYVTKDALVVSYVNVSKAMTQDGGVYQCTATNDVGIVRHQARINVTGSPFVRPMRNASAVAGEAITIHCPFGGYPIDSVTWEREGVRLPYNHRQKSFSNGSLEIRDVEKATDEGRYTCTARHKAQVARNSLYLNILVRPFIEPFGFPKSLHQGQRFNVLCTVTKGDSPVNIRWLKDGEAISHHEGMHTLQVTEFSSTLVFESVRPDHRGNYTCTASNVAGSASHTASMVIHVPPRWRIEPVDTSVVRGHTAIIDCQAEGFPPARVRWTKSEGEGDEVPGEYKTISSNSHMRVFENGSLAIFNTEEYDAGYYLCQASNGIGPGLSKVLRLTVHVAAHFESKFKAETVRKGHDAKLKCEAIGDKPLSISWLKDKLPFDPKEDPRYELIEVVQTHGVISEIIIHNADRRDSALFTCVASNNFGHDDTNLQLIMQESPDSPQDLKVVELSGRSIKVSWSPPYSGNSPITHYIVQYKEEGDKWQQKTSNITIPGSETSVAIRGLKPVTHYHIRVLAVNALGQSDPGPTVHVRTDEEAPGGPPLHVKGLPAGSHSVKVVWKPPRKELHNGVILGYYVGYRVTGSTDTFVYKTLEVKDGRSSEECMLSNLNRSTKYSVVVQAFNSKGAGPPSEEVIVETLQNDPPSAPELRVVTAASTSIHISWTLRRPSDSPITGYVLYQRKEMDEWLETSITGDREDFTVSSLRCGTRYQFYLMAFNSIGKGEPSDIISAKTDGMAPVPPDKQSLMTINSTAACIHLDAWHDGGCSISSFNVQYKPQRLRKWISLGTRVYKETKQLMLTDLTPATWYQLKITAFNEAGSTEAEYAFVTPSVTSESATTATVYENEVPPEYFDLNILLPAAVSLIVVLAIGILVCIIIRRRHLPESVHSGGSSYGLRKLHPPESLRLMDLEKSKKSLSNSDQQEPLYYPTPYATTRLSLPEDPRLLDPSLKPPEEPLYATVKRTPRPPRSDMHIYHYPLNATPEPLDVMEASTSQWKGASAFVKLEEPASEKSLSEPPGRSGSKRSRKSYQR